MAVPAQKLAQLLHAAGEHAIHCAACPSSKGWEKHIVGKEHFHEIWDILEGKFKQEKDFHKLKNSMWQEFEVSCGTMRFNHIDGEIQARLINCANTVDFRSMLSDFFNWCEASEESLEGTSVSRLVGNQTVKPTSSRYCERPLSSEGKC